MVNWFLAARSHVINSTHTAGESIVCMSAVNVFFLLFPRRAAGKQEQRPFHFTLISCCAALWKVNDLHLTASFYTYPVIYFVRNLKPLFNSQRKSPLHLNLTITRHFVAMKTTSQIYTKKRKKKRKCCAMTRKQCCCSSLPAGVISV